MPLLEDFHCSLSVFDIKLLDAQSKYKANADG